MHLKTMHSTQNNSKEDEIAGNQILTEHFCKVCAFTAVEEDDLNEHICKSIKCTRCEETFSNLEALGDHDGREHTVWYNCGECQYRSTIESECHKHVDTHKGDKVKCSKCKANFDDSKELYDHDTNEHGRQQTEVEEQIITLDVERNIGVDHGQVQVV